MKRKIISIDSDKCNGCGLCVHACHEGALQLVNGKATLVSESYCDGLGDCLPECPTGAIKIEEREAQDYDHAAVQARMAQKAVQNTGKLPCGCPSTRAKVLQRSTTDVVTHEREQSELRQWPCQIRLVPAHAPFLQNAKLLIAADCTAYAYPDVHRFMKNKITLIGCPKLDDEDYSQKLTEILAYNDIESITVLRMEVPCCGGIVNAVKTALLNSGKMIPWNVVTIATNGEIID
jgi:ferredoxin